MLFGETKSFFFSATASRNEFYGRDVGEGTGMYLRYRTNTNNGNTHNKTPLV
jgi:hypothetical protein